MRLPRLSSARTRVLCVILLGAVVLSTPSMARAGWGADGSRQPSTIYDIPAYMWPDPPGDDGDRVYFSVAATVGNEAAISPNSALLGSRIGGFGDATWRATLGVWADCNHDGYIGLATAALTEYREEAAAAEGHPVDTTICPEIADAESGDRTHSYGGWINELIPIVPLQAAEDRTGYGDFRVIQDPAVRIWGDFGTPGQGDPERDPEFLKHHADMNFVWQGPKGRGACGPQTLWQAEQFYGVSRVGGAPSIGRDPLGSLDPAAVPPLMCGGPSDAGLPLMAGMTGNAGWWSGIDYLGETPSVGIDVPSSEGWTVSTFEGDYVSFYAFVSVGGYQTPGGSGTYGAEACPAIGIDVPAANGWICDPTRWVAHAAGSAATVGDAYNLRDVECYDSNVATLDVPSGRLEFGPRQVPTINNPDPSRGCL